MLAGRWMASPSARSARVGCGSTARSGDEETTRSRLKASRGNGMARWPGSVDALGVAGPLALAQDTSRSCPRRARPIWIAIGVVSATHQRLVLRCREVSCPTLLEVPEPRLRDHAGRIE